MFEFEVDSRGAFLPVDACFEYRVRQFIGNMLYFLFPFLLKRSGWFCCFVQSVSGYVHCDYCGRVSVYAVYDGDYVFCYCERCRVDDDIRERFG